MRHVLRARVEAVKALAVFFDQLEHAGEQTGTGKRLKIRASKHLAEVYGGFDVSERSVIVVVGIPMPTYRGGGMPQRR
jgi:hypothetical protein